MTGDRYRYRSEELETEEIERLIAYPALDEEFREKLRGILEERKQVPSLTDMLDEGMKQARMAVSDYRTDVEEFAVQIMLAIRCGDEDHACWLAMLMRDRAMGTEGVWDE